MRFAGGGGQDVLYLDSAEQQCVADEGAMAAPGDSLGAHDRDPPPSCEGDEYFQTREELGCLHVICVTAK